MADLQPTASPSGPSRIATKFLIISDTHAQFPSRPLSSISADVAIHCGDLTEGSKLDEFQAALRLLKQINAPLKLVIAGNHDFSLDEPAYRATIEEASRVAGEDLEADIKRDYGDYGAARQLFDDAKENGIVFLDEGSNRFSLDNGATLSIYASPYIPSHSTDGSRAGRGFQYSKNGHDFSIPRGVDVVVTHGPPLGLMDMGPERKRLGCPGLFSSLARAQPKMHCFGHVHSGWGAKLVAWRETISEQPSHFADIDNDKSYVVETLATLRGNKFETDEEMSARKEKVDRLQQQGYCQASIDQGSDTKPGGKTMVVNAALMGSGELTQLPWVVSLDLEADPDLAEKGDQDAGDGDGGVRKRKPSDAPEMEEPEAKRSCV